jgi:penicillin-binding protein 1A
VQRVETAEGELLYDAGTDVERVCPEPETESGDVAADVATDVAADGATSNFTAGLVDLSGSLFPLQPRCALRVESPQRIFLITTVLKVVVRSGSGARAGTASEGRNDLFGKTGTTNGPRDAWFAGGNAEVIAVAWVGFDNDSRELGSTEQGGRTAIPAWIDYMRVALDGMPDRELPRPPGIVELRVVRETGLRAADCRRDVPFEYFLEENQPEREPESVCFGTGPLPQSSDPGAAPGTNPRPGPASDRLFE